MRKLISFLGYSKSQEYSNTTYHYSDKSYQSKFATAAMTHFFKPDKTLVLVTAEAKAQNFTDLSTVMQQSGMIDPEACDIPSGKTEAEMWEIFSTIAQKLDEGDSVVFDMTNGFRTLPMLSFIAAAYIRTVRSVQIEALVYGAFDARTNEKFEEHNCRKRLISCDSPVFDLTPFLTLLDWTTATSTFLSTGRAEGVVELAKRTEAAGVEAFAEKMHELSQELLTTRPVGTIKAASELNTLLGSIDFSAPQVQPLELLFDEIKKEYTNFALLNKNFNSVKDRALYEEVRDNFWKFLTKQLEMIKWYIDKELPIQAMTLAREWIISLEMYHENMHTQSSLDVFSYKERNKIKTKGKNAKIDDAIRKLRNDIAHCGMDLIKGVHSASEIIIETKSIYNHMKNLLAESEEQR